MISKKINRQTNQSSPAHLIRYILDINTHQESRLWETPEEYCPTNGEKLESFRLSNIHASVPGMAIFEIDAIQAQNTRSKADKLYHLVISFPDDEKPSKDQLIDIEYNFIRALGYQEHQRVSAIHQDTDNLHVHIVINKIHPKTFNCHEPYKDYQIRDKLSQALEIKHGLIQDNHKWQGKTQAKHNEHSQFLTHLKEKVAPLLKADYQRGEGWKALHQTLAQFDLEIKPRGAGLIISDKNGETSVKASTVLRCLSIQSLTKRFGPYVEPLTKTRQNDERDKSTTQSSRYQCYLEARQLQNSHRTEVVSKQVSLAKEEWLQTRDWYTQKRLQIKQNHRLSANEKRIEYKKLFLRQRTDRAHFYAKIEQIREEAKTNFPRLSWVKFSQQNDLDKRKGTSPVPLEPKEVINLNSPSLSNPAISPALQAYIDSRNLLGQRISTIKHHQLWDPKDSGPFIYQGNRQLSDGSSVWLLERDGIILVKPHIEALVKNQIKIGEKILFSHGNTVLAQGHNDPNLAMIKF